jgi:sigma-B regulation protein RsbU (phosphoserine phosphatase)
MSNITNPSELQQSMRDAIESATKLDDATRRLTRSLDKHGIQISLNLGELTGDLLKALFKASRISEGVVKQFEQLQNLVSSTARITSSLHLDQVLEQVMESVISMTGAERAYLMLRDPDTNELLIHKARNWDNQVVPEQDRAFSRSVINSALEKAEPIILLNAQNDARFGTVESVIAQGLISIMCIPLLLDDRTVGVLYAEHRIRQAIFSADMIPLLAAFGTQAAIAIEKARLHEEELQKQRIDQELSVGQRIQLSLLPKSCPTMPGWDFAATYQAARVVGGDFYDFVALPDGQLGIVVADVADKGIPAAIFMAVTRTMIHTAALNGDHPSETLTQTNQLITENSTTDLFLTAFYAVLDSETGHLLYANAGHNHPLLFHAATGTFERLTAHGIILGQFPDIRLENREAWIVPGDVAVFYTDGLTEAMTADHQEFGEERLYQAIADNYHLDANGVMSAIVEALAAFTQDAVPSDDLTIVVVKRLE